MTYNILKTAAGVFALLGVLTLGSCSDKEDMPIPGSDNGEADFSLAIKGMPAASAASSLDAISVFQFGKDNNLFSKSVINAYNPESIDLVKGNTRALYVVSGIGIDATEETTEAQFALTTVSTEEGADSAPLFLSGKAAIEADQMQCELTLKRGVARIDLDARDADMDITSVTVEDAPAASYVFAGNGVLTSPGTVAYRHEYTTAPTGVEKSLFMLFESAGEVHVNVHGTVDGVEIDVPAVIDNVERNKVYTLRVYDKNATVKAGFTVTDWEIGDDIVGGTDLSKGLFIDEAASVIPEGVTVDYLNNIIEVTGDGVKGLKIAFSSEVRIDVDTLVYSGERVVIDSVAEKYVKITPEKAYNTDRGVITLIDVDIDPQLKGRPDYEFDIYVKKMFMATSYDKVKIKVAPSKFQIPTVMLAGVEWMAFNSTTPYPDDQIYVDEGKTVEDMYAADWLGCVGGLFQYGRQYMYVPYLGYNPVNDLGNQKQDMPWIHETHMPSPEGYHVATLEEWHALFPEGTRLTDKESYVAGNGEVINVEIIRLPDDPVTPTNVGGQARYMKLTSAETGNYLILPLGGYKGDKWTGTTPGFGKDVVFWSNNCTDCYGGHARAMRFMFNWKVSCTAEEFQWPMEAFAYVRAVKN